MLINGIEYRYNPRSGRWVSASNGQLLSAALLTREQQRLSKVLRKDLIGLTRRFQGGRIDAEEWRRLFQARIERSHYESAALAAGGEERLGEAHKRAVRELLAEEYGYLDKFAEDVRKGILGLPVLIRAARYSTALSLSYSKSELITRKQDGWTRASRSLTPEAMHCKHCPGYATFGWVGIDSIIPRGWQCDCRNSCRCVVRYGR